MLYVCVTLGGFEQCCQHSLCVAPESCVCNRLRWILNSSFLQGRKVIACRASSGRIRCLQPASRVKKYVGFACSLPAHFLVIAFFPPYHCLLTLLFFVLFTYSLPICSLAAHCRLNVCSLHAHCVLIACSLPANCLFACSLPDCLYIAPCSLAGHRLLIGCLQPAHCLLIVWLPSHWLIISCSQPSHCLIGW